MNIKQYFIRFNKIFNALKYLCENNNLYKWIQKQIQIPIDIAVYNDDKSYHIFKSTTDLSNCKLYYNEDNNFSSIQLQDLYRKYKIPNLKYCIVDLKQKIPIPLYNNPDMSEDIFFDIKVFPYLFPNGKDGYF